MPPVELSMDDFCRLAKRVCDAMPEPFLAWMKNVVVDVRNRPSRRQLRSVGLDPDEDDLLGLFEGRPVTEAPSILDDSLGAFTLNRVWLFREPILAVSRSTDEAAYEIRRTIIHELAHHFGWSEADLDEFESQPSPFDRDENDGGDLTGFTG